MMYNLYNYVTSPVTPDWTSGDDMGESYRHVKLVKWSTIIIIFIRTQTGTT